MIRRQPINDEKISTTSIRRRLIQGGILLIVGALAAFAIGIYVTVYRPFVTNLAALAMGSASEIVAQNIETVFTRVETIATRNREWGRNGLINLDDLDRFNRLLAPMFLGSVGISSMAVAYESGQEVLIVSQPDGGWFNRLTNPGSWGNRERVLNWEGRGTLTGSSEQQVDYDARKRPWFVAAMALANDADIYWTPPYRFVSTGDLGISAVVRWTSLDSQKTAMTTDFTLLSLTRTTQDINLGRAGLAAVLTDDGDVIGLPRDKRFASADAINAALLMPVDKLAVAPLSLAFRAWQATGRPDSTIVGFEVGGRTWLTSFHSIHLANQVFWAVTLAPQADFLILTGNILALSAVLVIASILLASVGAIWLGRRFSIPIERLIGESARIGQMNLAQPIEIISRVREINDLARSLEGMRRNLLESRTQLATTAELERQLEQSRKLEALGQLAAGIAHDFNNALTIVLGYAGLLKNDIPAGTPQYRFVEHIVAGGERAQEFVRQILAFARQSRVERKLANLVDMVKEVHALLRSSLPSSTELVLAIEADELIANVNGAQITQVLLNLCINANDALLGKTGTITIRISSVLPGNAESAAIPNEPSVPPGTVRRRDEQLWIGTLDPRLAYGCITIADNGAGMDPQVLDRIFEPYFTTKARGKGTGLGLAVVQGIVSEYAGACIVNSRPGIGTQFAIYFPLASGTPQRVAAESREPAPRGHESILVVDDDSDVAEMLSVSLGRLGYRLASFSDPEQALDAFVAEPMKWDAVVSDQVMPKLDGLSMLHRMKSIRPEILFILCSGWADGLSEATALRAGAAVLFVKPVAPERIAAAIRQFLDAPRPPSLPGA
jgi:signal transduction histidine kinase/ActR/RegA family two-component response regulator